MGVLKYLQTGDAAFYLGLSPKTLEKMRVRGNGPKFFKFGSRVLYSIDSLEQWAQSNLRQSTTDRGGLDINNREKGKEGLENEKE